MTRVRRCGLARWGLAAEPRGRVGQALLLGLALLVQVVASNRIAWASSRTSGQAWEDELAAVTGAVGYQWLDLRQLNELLARASLPALPSLPDRGGYEPGFGVVGRLGDRWAFSTLGGELVLEGKESEPGGGLRFARLRFNNTGVGLHYVLWASRPLRAMVGATAGLAGVELEWADWSAGQPGSLGELLGTPGPSGVRGGRLSRQVLTLQPALSVHWAFSGSAGLQLEVGYTLGTDFWGPRWAHAAGAEFEGIPAVFTGPFVRLGVLVGTL